MKTLTAKNIKENLIIESKSDPEWGTWRILNKYDDGIWEIRGDSGEKCLFESELNFWNVVR